MKTQNYCNENLINHQMSSGSLNIAIYDFINCLPIFVGLNSLFDTGMNITLGTPSEINNLLDKGKVQVGPISSYHYLMHQDKYVLCEGLSISAQKEVGSVLLFSKYCLDELAGKKIALDSSSSTSVNLLKVLLLESKVDSFELEVCILDNKLENYLNNYDAVLCIGDLALKIADSLREKESVIKIYDLAKLWFDKTNLPMVFGLWVVNKEWHINNIGLSNDILSCLINAKDIGLGILREKMIALACSRYNFSQKLIERYFDTQLDYNLNIEHKNSLDVFYKKLLEYNLMTKSKEK